jgi:hypothetical protein
VREIICKRPGFIQLNIQLAGLSAFRDRYGFMAADEALSFAGQALTETIAKDGTVDDFVGTSAEDQFVVFTFSANPQTFIDALTVRFKEGVKRLYNFADTERGYMIITENDQEIQVPLMHFVVSRTEELVPSGG